jgi:O-antigen/teichoic acid export membrane protein
MSVDLIEQLDATAKPDRVGASILDRLRDLARRSPLAYNGILSLADQAIVSGTSFVTAVIVARGTSEDELGSYYLLLSIVLIISGIQDQVVASPFIVHSKGLSGRELAEYRGSTWIHHFLLTAVVWVALLLTTIGLSLGATQGVPGIQALLWVSPLLLLREGIRRFALADLRLVTVIVVDVLVLVLQVGGLALLAYSGRLSLLYVFAAMGVACALASAGWCLMRRPAVCFQWHRFLSDWWHNWSFGKWALQSYLLGNLTPYLMLWILNAFMGTGPTGVFGACVALLGITNIFVLGVGNVLLPQSADVFRKRGSSGLRRLLLKIAGFLVLVLGTVCLAVVLVGEQVAVIVYGEHFKGCEPILIALAFNVLFSSLQMTGGMGLCAINRPRANLVADLCWTSATLLLAVVLVPSYGVFGASLATVAGTAVGTLARFAILMRALECLPDAVQAGHQPAASQP